MTCNGSSWRSVFRRHVAWRVRDEMKKQPIAVTTMPTPRQGLLAALGPMFRESLGAPPVYRFAISSPRPAHYNHNRSSIARTHHLHPRHHFHLSEWPVNVEGSLLAGLPSRPRSPQPLLPHRSSAQHPLLPTPSKPLPHQLRLRHRPQHLRVLVSLDRWHLPRRKSFSHLQSSLAPHSPAPPNLSRVPF